MKKVIFMGVFLSLAGIAGAQSGKRALQNAYQNYSNQYYDKAKTAIDECITYEDTKADAKTWFYRGNIYLMVEFSKSKKDSNRYKNLCDNCGEIAFDAYMKAFEIDPKLEVPGMVGLSTIQAGLKNCSDILVNESIDAINKQDYERAYLLAQKACKADGEKENAIYCMGLTAELLKKTDEAKSNYDKLVKSKSKTMPPYVRLALIYQTEDDKPNAVKVMEEGANIFLNDTAFDVKYAEAYAFIMLWAGNSKDGIAIAEKALKRNPKSYTMLVSVGTKLTENKKYEDAEDFLKRALEIESDDIVANYNLGFCYFQNALDKFEEQNNVPLNDNESYERLKAEGNALLEKAMPYVEKAHELDPNDKHTLTMLQKIYARIEGKTEERKATEEKLQELKKNE